MDRLSRKAERAYSVATKRLKRAIDASPVFKSRERIDGGKDAIGTERYAKGMSKAAVVLLDDLEDAVDTFEQEDNPDQAVLELADALGGLPSLGDLDHKIGAHDLTGTFRQERHNPWLLADRAVTALYDAVDDMVTGADRS